MYSITTNRTKRRVALVFAGPMQQDPAQLFEELQKAANQIRNIDGEWDILVDFIQTSVMPQDRADNTMNLYAWCMANGLRKAAFVMGSAILRMQVARVTNHGDNVGHFTTFEDAAVWLDS